MKTHLNGDPFSRIPIPRSFYHPSQQKKLSKTDKKVALSPSKDRYVSPEDELFLKGSNIFSSKTPPTRDKEIGLSKFDESWPSSERPSLTSVSGYNERTDRDRVSDVDESLFKKTHHENTKTGSVLQRYVNRFRNSAPMSREDRIKKGVGSDRDFWWLSSNPPTPNNSSTPKDEDYIFKRSRQFIDRTESQAYSDTFKSLLDLQANSQSVMTHLEEDVKTQRLQEKATRILVQSESSIGSFDIEPAISSDGLANSVSHSSASFEEPSHRATYRNNLSEIGPPYSSQKLPAHVSNMTRPEDDILYQWRLQKKMDLSRLGAAKMIAKNNSEVQSKLKEIQQKLLTKELLVPLTTTPVTSVQYMPNPSVTLENNLTTKPPASTRMSVDPEPVAGLCSQQPSLQRPNIASPTLAHNQTASQESVEPHLHLMCDVLPCPHAKSYQRQFEDLYMDQNVETSRVHENENQYDSSGHYIQFLEAEKPHSDRKGKCAKVRVRNKVAQTQIEFKVSEELEHIDRLKGRPTKTETVVQSLDSVDESLDFEQSDNEQTLAENVPGVLSAGEWAVRGPRIYKNLKDDKHQSTDLSKTPIVQPKYSSSPARSKTLINTAIGQAVKDYMFTTSSSSVISSVDSISSLPPAIPERRTDEEMNDLDRYKNDSNSFRDDKNTQRKHAEENENISDGEYPNDQLLILLRQQREVIEKKLGEIDKCW